MKSILDICILFLEAIHFTSLYKICYTINSNKCKILSGYFASAHSNE